MIIRNLLLGLCLLAGCQADPNLKKNKKAMLADRMETISAQTFYDARELPRDVLVMRDKQTGKEYLVVMGAGVGEMYKQGKAEVED